MSESREIRLKLDSERLKEAAERVVAEIKGASLDLKGLHGFFGLWAVIPRVVERVEKVGGELKALGEDKKAIATEAILALVPDNWLPDWVLRPLVSWGIERALALLKKRLG